MNKKNIEPFTSENYTDKTKFICDICQKLFFMKIHYQLHSVIHLLPKHFDCCECQKGFAEILSLDKHIETHNNGMGVICHVCKEEFFDVDSLNEHAAKHSNQSKNTLIVQQGTDNEKTLVTIHNEAKGSCHSEKYSLPLKVVDMNSIIQGNSHKHEELEPVSFKIVDSFHVSDDDNDEPLVSDALDISKNDILSENSQICESVKLFAAKSEETQNKSTNLCSQIPQTIEKFICEVCKKVFENKQSLTIHFSTHSEEKTFDCHLCEKKFSFKSLLDVHLEAHRIQESYFDEYKKSFASKDKLFNPVHCEVCKKVFENEHSLTLHSSTHKEIFNCHLCEKKFYFKSLLNAHLQTHETMEISSISTNPIIVKQITCNESTPIKVINSEKHAKNSNSGMTNAIIIQEVHNEDSQIKTVNTGKFNICQTENTKDSVLEKNVSCGTLQSIFRCAKCNKEFLEEKQFNDHHRNCCMQGQLSSDKCEELAPETITLVDHFSASNDNDDQPLVSDVLDLGEKVISSENSQVHENEKIFVTKSKETQNKKYSRNPKTRKKFICKVCKKEFENKESLTIHISTESEKEMLSCHLCEKKFFLKNHLESHLRAHKTKKFSCVSANPVIVKQIAHNENTPIKIINSENHHAKNSNSGTTNTIIIQEIHSEDSQIKTVNSGKFNLCHTENSEGSVLEKNVSSDTLQSIFRCDKCNKEFLEEQQLNDHHQNYCIQDQLDSDKFEDLLPVSFTSVDNFPVSNDRHDKPLVCNVLDSAENVIPSESSEIYKNVSIKSFLTKSKQKQNENETTNLCSQKLVKFICGVCKKVFKKMHSLRKHLSTHSEEKMFCCHLCEKKFSFKSLLSTHLRTHDAKKFPCSVCQKIFASKNKLFNHIHIHAKVKSFGCSACHMKFSEKSLLEEHRRLSHSSKECDICHKILSSRTRMFVHRRTHSGSRPYVCNICSKSYTIWTNLNRHKRIHTGEKPFKCEICGACFTRKESLTQHRMVHDGKRKETKRKHNKKLVKECSLCPEGFILKSSGNSRLCVHLENKPFKCDICGRTFSTKAILRTHQYVHSGQRPYVCEICNKGFLYKANLIVHHRSHTGEKPFLCETCGKTFTGQAGLIQHPCNLKKHAPIKCEVCQKGFAFKSSLDIHARIHRGEKPFVCDLCDRKFTQKVHLKRHLQLMHGKDSASVM